MLPIYIGVGLLAAATLWGLLRKARYAKCVAYPVGDDQAHRFDDSLDEVLVRNGAAALPPVPPDCGALFLEVELRATLWGRWFDPSVKAWTGDRVCVHFFERGASGKRWLNLSHLISALGEGAVCTFQTKGMSVPDQQASLQVHFGALLPTDRIVVVAPHPDDAEIAAYGLYRSRPKQSWLVTLTAGDNSLRYRHLAESDRDASELCARLRSGDPYACGALAGVPVHQILNLGYFDSTLASMRMAWLDSPDSPAPVASIHGASSHRSSALRDKGWQPTWPNLVDDLRRLIEDSQAGIVVCPHPLLDAHEDHRMAALAACEAILRSPALEVKLLLYTNHSHAGESYPLGPPSSVVTLPPVWDNRPQVGSLFSFDLDPKLQAEKRLALECNHALRDVPGTASASLLRTIGSLLLGSGNYSHSYFRRAVRQNELFWVVEGAQIEQLHNLAQNP